MLEDTRRAYSFDGFNFGSDQSVEPEMALAQELWRELGETAETEQEQSFDIEEAGWQKAESEPKPDILPFTIFELGLGSVTVVPSFANVFRGVPTHGTPLEIQSSPDIRFTEGRAMRKINPQAAGCAVRQVNSLTAQIDASGKQFELGLSTWVDRIASVISRHEGRADSINWNDNGAG